MLKSSMGIVLLMVLVAGVFVPVDIPYSFESTAKVYPLQRWELRKNTDGSLMSSLHSFRTGQMSDYASYQFDRGDVVQIQFYPNKNAGQLVDSGQMVASIHSNMLAGRLVQLENQLQIERALLLKEGTGEKEEILSSLEEHLALAEQEVTYQQQQLVRSQKMYADGLISATDLEANEQAYRLAVTRVQLAKENITISATGEKPEQINLIQARIASLEKEIAFQKATSERYSIFAPISGRLSFQTGVEGDQLFIDDISQHILFVPVKLKDRDFINEETRFELDIMGVDTTVEAKFEGLMDQVEIYNNQAVVIAKASISSSVAELTTGMPVKCTVHCGTVQPLEYMSRSVQTK